MAGKKMLLVNPKRRRRKASGKKRSARRTPARRRTTRTNPRRTTRAVRRRTRKASPTRRRRRSNPSRRGIMGKFVTPSLMGGGTAIGLDAAFGYLPLPDMMTTGIMRHASKAAAAIGVGMFLPDMGVVKRSTAEEMARGALTVYVTDAMRESMATFLPDIPLGYYSPAYVPPGQNGGMNEYLSEYVSGAGGPMGASDIRGSATGFGEYADPMTGDTALY